MTNSPDGFDTVLVVDFGAQYAQLIARRVRECRVFSEIVPSTMPLADMLAKRPKAIILSGGPSSVYADGAPPAPAGLFDAGVPVLGICYGFQLMVAGLGGTVERTGAAEYGATGLQSTGGTLLSGTPKHQKERGSKGGLLRQIGEFGILVLKDFGSILSMRPEARAEAMGALREIYDGYYPRHLGTGGGRTLEWQGKLGLIFCATEAYDAHHAVIGVLGDRFLLCRLEPASSNKQFDMALRHAGAATSVMRAELAAVVAELFARELREPRPLGRVEHARLRQVVGLAVRLRGGVERDRRTRELDQVYGAEGPGRLALSLERLLAGLDALGLEREAALKVVEHVAMSSTPPIRRHAWEALALGPLTTRRVADRLRLPTSTARRALEELMAHGLVVRLEEGGADKWRRLTADDT